jgi:hypothetical protein
MSPGHKKEGRTRLYTRLVRADERNHIVGKPIGLHVSFPEIALAVVLHEHLQFRDLGTNDAPSAQLFLVPVTFLGVRPPSQVIFFKPSVRLWILPFLTGFPRAVRIPCEPGVLLEVAAEFIDNSRL